MAKTVKIYAPNEQYTGTVAGVAFAKGVAEVDEENTGRIDYFRRKGYGVGEKPGSEAGIADNIKGSEKMLKDMTNDELDEVGKGLGIVGISSMNKAEKIEAIEEARKPSE